MIDDIIVQPYHVSSRLEVWNRNFVEIMSNEIHQSHQMFVERQMESKVNFVQQIKRLSK